MKKIYLFLLSAILLSIFVIGCSDDDEIPLVPKENLKFVTSFTENWINPSLDEGFLFYSDLDGSELWSDSWRGNADLEVEIPNTGERVSVTTVVEEREGDVTYIYLTTNYAVKAKGWTYRGVASRWAEEIGETELQFQNIPDHSGYRISSKYSSTRSRSGTIAANYSKRLYTSPDNCYIRLNTNANGPQYIWANDVWVNDSKVVDLANLSPLSSKVINFPTNGEEISFSLHGLGDNNYYSGTYLFDNTFGLNYDLSSNSYTVYFPQDGISGFRTSFYIDEEPYPTNNFWSHTVIGDIPSSMSKINADFSFVSTSPTNFKISANGDYSQIASYWQYDEGNGKVYRWIVYSEGQEHSLPELPEIIKTKYPALDQGLFTLTYAYITKHLGVSDYDELMKKMFEEGGLYYNIVDGQLVRSKDPNGLRP